MTKCYLKMVPAIYAVSRLLLSFLFLLLCQFSFAQVKDSSITAIYTNFKSYWATNTTTPSTVQPDSSHNLLAFTFRGTTYSTGVNNATLNTRLGSANYATAVFKALPVNSISGTVASGGATYLATAIKNDGDSTTFGYKSPFPNIHIADVLTDGKFGLDLGTGVTNLPKGARISFAIQNLNTKAATDTIPDLVFTQIADPTGNVPDTIFFYDVNGNVVGNKKLVNWSTVNKLGTYKLDLYAFQTGVSCNTSSINSSFQANGTRDIRMVAFLITEFGITNSDSTAKVKGITIATSGTSDQAFIAYNTSILNLNVPTITTQPASQLFCSNATTSATFSVAASSGTTMTYQWKKNGANISGATSSSYTVSGLTVADTVNAYSVTVTNSVGSVNSDNAYITYTIVTQPSNQYVATGSSATFTVKTSGATGFQWYKGGTAISGATSASYTIPSATLAISGSSYYVIATYSGGSCTSSSATLTVENLPSITAQPQAQVLCNSSITSATFSVTATSTSALSYQWYRSNIIISGATSSSYTPAGLILSDTANTYKVVVTNGVGSTTSSSVGFKYLVLTQPVSQYVITASSITFSVTASSIATSYQWQKNGTNISGATSRVYTNPSVALSDTGSYTVAVSYPGSSCVSNTALLRVENAPVITTQPSLQVLCNSSTTSATFSVAATSVSAISYQWYKNGTAIASATSGSYTATGLTYNDTTSTYYVVLTNGVGSITSSSSSIKYLTLTQPTGSYIATGASATFSVTASAIATGYQWQKAGINIIGATLRTYTISSASLLDAGNYTVVVSYSGGSCTSSAATLTVENKPLITTQPQLQVLCNISSTTATYSTIVSSVSLLSYQWYKNGISIPGATSSSYTATGLSYADTMNTYAVKILNGVGFSISNSAGLKYLILSQPAASNYLPTGNPVILSALPSSSATSLQWKKDGADVTGANLSSYRIDTVGMASAGKYTLKINYLGGFCTTDTSVLTVTTTLYSKATGDINTVANWGVMPDGSGAAPLTFTRPEHTFVMANRTWGANDTNMVISGTYDLGNSLTVLNAGTTLEAGRIISSQAGGKFSVTPTSSLIVHGKSDLYFDAANKVLKNLTIITTDTVTLHSALSITGGKGHGTVKITQGVFKTGDSLLLKSDSLGTASVGNSPGTITGKVTIERYIPAHRAWRLFSSPVSDSLAPTIHDAWQEGAINSTDNPHLGFGTHITYGNEADGFDQNPQHTYSIKVRNASGQWIGIPNTNRTKVTDYPAYFLFIRGDRSYDITQTTNTTTPKPTLIRTTGYLKQHTQPTTSVNNTGFTLVANPFASSVDFESVYQHSSVSRHMWMWNPNLAGSKGVGAYVLVYWNGSGYSTTPALPGANDLRFLQAYQGFFVESNGGSSAIGFTENDKDTSSFISAFGREVAGSTPRLEINLNVFNSDSTTGVADGAAYLFDNSFSDSVDRDDITKQLPNINENAGILSNGKLLSVEQRSMPTDKDSLQLSLTNTKSAAYQLDIIPNKMDNFSLYLYDRYLGTKTPLKAADTSHIKIDINTSVAASKAADRFVIISKTAPQQVVMFTHISAAAKDNAIMVDWSTVNEANVSSYKVERSADGIHFTEIAAVIGSGKKDYSYADSKPLSRMNYYRIRSITKTNASSYSGIVSESIVSNTQSSVSVYPNPLTSNHCIIDLHNKPAGKYDLTLTDNIGIVVFTTSVTITEGNSKQALVLPAALAQGTYHLTIENNNTKETIKLVSLY